MKYAITIIAGVLLALALMFLAPKFAHAQGMVVSIDMACNKSAVVLKMLQDKYKEKAVGGGVTPGGGHIRLFVSDTASFTVILTSPDGISCVITGGDNWTTETAKPIGHDS